MLNDERLMSRGMRCLIDNLGIIEAERFVALLSRERGDYTDGNANIMTTCLRKSFWQVWKNLCGITPMTAT